ncbi:FtsX-like permease family protein [Streptomyces sp. NPDC056527]|uniref:FtsX-like permease family protein n=1 Tax=Streptomyces sp. NPDC056527 TaxID=3345853 RepID=UPI003683EBBF
MPWLTLATLRARKGGFLGTFVALLFGSAVLSVCGILLESGLRSGVPPQRYAAADVVVSGRQQADMPVDGRGAPAPAPLKPTLVERVPVPAELAPEIRALKEVRAVVADIGVPAHVVGPDGAPLAGAGGTQSLGHNWSSTELGPFRLTAGHAPAGMTDVVLDADLAARADAVPGDRLSLTTDAGTERFRVSGIVALQSHDGPLRQPAVFFSDAFAESRSVHPGRVDSLGVLAAPGTSSDELADAVSTVLDGSDVSVRTGDDRAEAEFLDVAMSGPKLVLLAVSVAGNIFLVTIFVVSSTLSLAVGHRRRELALLRAVGAAPRQVRRMVTAEALAVALAGGVLGWPVGVLVVRWIGGRLAEHGFVPFDFAPVYGALPAVGAVVVTVLTAYLAALTAARRATRIRPTEALGEAAVEPAGLGRWRAATGAALVLGSAALFAVGLNRSDDFAALVGLANSLVLTVVIAAAVLGPLVSRASMRIVGPALRTSRVTGHLAAANNSSQVRRLAGAVTPLVLAVSFAATVIFAESTSQHTAREQREAGLVADHVLTSPVKVPPGVVEELRGEEGVRAVTGLVTSSVVGVAVGSGSGQAVPLSAQGLDPKALPETVDLDLRRGEFGRLGPDTVALSTTASSRLGLDVGETAQLRLGDGTLVTPRVVAVYDRGLGFADLTFDRAVLSAHTTTGMDDSVLVRADAEARDDVRKALVQLVEKHPSLQIADRISFNLRMQEQQAYAWVNYLITGLIIAYSGVTVVNAQVMNTMVRRREFALLRLSGITSHQVMRMVTWESAAVAVIGVGLGTLAAFPALSLIALALTGSVMPTVSPLAYLSIAGGTAGLAALGAFLPARLLLLRRPIHAIGSRE